jgi:uncharacterized SAM-binding protein YcdF (DUF218 family)
LAATTYDEALALVAFLKDKPEARVLVVTDDYHTRRSRWVLDRALGEKADRASFVSAPYTDFTEDRWWRDEGQFIAVATEYPKLIFYIVYYGYIGYWLLACAGLAVVAMAIRRRSRRGVPPRCFQEV